MCSVTAAGVPLLSILHCLLVAGPSVPRHAERLHQVTHHVHRISLYAAPRAPPPLLLLRQTPPTHTSSVNAPRIITETSQAASPFRSSGLLRAFPTAARIRSIGTPSRPPRSSYTPSPGARAPQPRSQVRGCSALGGIRSGYTWSCMLLMRRCMHVLQAAAGGQGRRGCRGGRCAAADLARSLAPGPSVARSMLLELF